MEPEGRGTAEEVAVELVYQPTQRDWAAALRVRAKSSGAAVRQRRLVICAAVVFVGGAGVSAANGDPDRLGFDVGSNTSVAVVAGAELFPGLFFALPELAGPFPPNGTTGTVNLAAVAITNPFDSAVSSDTGDVWQQSVDATAPYTPLTLHPGQSGTTALTITPTATAGTLVQGFVAIDTFNLATSAGDEVLAVPYKYRVR